MPTFDDSCYYSQLMSGGGHGEVEGVMNVSEDVNSKG